MLYLKPKHSSSSLVEKQGQRVGYKREIKKDLCGLGGLSSTIIPQQKMRQNCRHVPMCSLVGRQRRSKNIEIKFCLRLACLYLPLHSLIQGRQHQIQALHISLLIICIASQPKLVIFSCIR